MYDTLNNEDLRCLSLELFEKLDMNKKCEFCDYKYYLYIVMKLLDRIEAKEVTFVEVCVPILRNLDIIYTKFMENQSDFEYELDVFRDLKVCILNQISFTQLEGLKEVKRVKNWFI